MDVRRHVKEMGLKFFGNGLLLHDLNISIDEFDKSDSSTLAREIRKSQPSVNRETYIKYLNDLESRIKESSIHSLKPYDPEKGCLVTNLSRMPLHKLDFGSGGPDFVFLVTIGKNSTAILADRDDYLLRFVN